MVLLNIAVAVGLDALRSDWRRNLICRWVTNSGQRDEPSTGIYRLTCNIEGRIRQLASDIQQILAPYTGERDVSVYVA